MADGAFAAVGVAVEDGDDHGALEVPAAVPADAFSTGEDERCQRGLLLMSIGKGWDGMGSGEGWQERKRWRSRTRSDVRYLLAHGGRTVAVMMRWRWRCLDEGTSATGGDGI
jgi:hypothetical protein